MLSQEDTRKGWGGGLPSRKRSEGRLGEAEEPQDPAHYWDVVPGGVLCIRGVEHGAPQGCTKQAGSRI